MPDDHPKWASDGSNKGPMIWALAVIAALFLLGMAVETFDWW